MRVVDLFHASRGCRFHCFPCCTPFLGGRRFWPRFMSRVAEELATIDNDRLFVVDNSLAQDTAWEKELFRTMIPFKKRGCCHPIEVDDAVLDLAAQAGAWYVYQAIHFRVSPRLNAEVFEAVPHRQWVFTIPRRLRVYFRYDRSLLGRFCQAAYATVCDVFGLEVDGSKCVPALVLTPQTQGDLLNWHPHVHGVVAEGVFSASGDTSTRLSARFVHIPDIQKHRAEELWQERVFALLLESHKIDEQTAGSMKSWRHSGFSVDTSVRSEGNDHAGMSRLVGYIARSPLSLVRMVARTDEGDASKSPTGEKIVYRASHAYCRPFPKSGEETLMPGIPRNHEIFDPLDFLAEVTQHILTRENTRLVLAQAGIRYYGHYSNKSRGMREKVLKAALAPKPVEPLTQQQLRFRLTWAALIKLVDEVDPLKCPDCGGTMKIVALIDQSRHPEVVEKMLRHTPSS